MNNKDRFVTLKKAKRIWAVGAIHGNVDGLCRIHSHIADKIQAGDKLVYLGNYLGYGADILPTIQELLYFRRWFLAIPPITTMEDIVFLRGRQEEMWQKLRQLQFAPKPEEILFWAKDHGLSQTLKAFGLSVEKGLESAAEGALALASWTTKLKQAGHLVAGHDAFFSSLKHAAFNEEFSMLFVSSGLDVTQPLSKQLDNLWWRGQSFDDIKAPYGRFQKIIRGYDPAHKGYQQQDFTISLDCGTPELSKPVGLCLSKTGSVEDIIMPD